MNKVQIFIIVVSIILAIGAVFVFTRGSGNSGQTSGGSVVVWGTLSSDVMKPILQAFSKETKIGASYVQIDENNFTERLLKAIATDTGPDALVQRADWIKSNKSVLAPLPSGTMSLRDYQNTYVDIASSIFIEGDSIFALPVSIDPLVLYWNKDLFNAASLPLPPKNWDDVLVTSNQIKKIGDGGAVNRGGIALGRAHNIPLAKNILSLLLIQLGGDIEATDGKFIFNREGSRDTDSRDSVGIRVLKFYTDFGRNGTGAYTWNTSLPKPRDLFLEGKLGMMIDYMSYIPTAHAKNPHLSFDIARPPQVKNAEFPIYFASAEGVAVPRRSKNASNAWSLGRWLGSPTGNKLYLASRSMGPARRDLLDDPEFVKNPLAPLLRELTLNARGVRDTYIDDNASLLREMVEGIADDRIEPSSAIENAKRKSAPTREKGK